MCRASSEHILNPHPTTQNIFCTENIFQWQNIILSMTESAWSTNLFSQNIASISRMQNVQCRRILFEDSFPHNSRQLLYQEKYDGGGCLIKASKEKRKNKR
jgi:hypothetical protein